MSDPKFDYEHVSFFPTLIGFDLCSSSESPSRDMKAKNQDPTTMTNKAKTLSKEIGHVRNVDAVFNASKTCLYLNGSRVTVKK